MCDPVKPRTWADLAQGIGTSKGLISIKPNVSTNENLKISNNTEGVNQTSELITNHTKPNQTKPNQTKPNQTKKNKTKKTKTKKTKKYFK